MLHTAAVRPLEALFRRPTSKKPSEPTKHIILPLNRGSIFCFCEDAGNHQPVILRAFRMAELRVGRSSLSASIMDDEGQWYERAWGPEDSDSQLDLFKGLFLLNADIPIRSKPNPPYGPRAVFNGRIPEEYRVHHLSYLHRKFPNAISKIRGL